MDETSNQNISADLARILDAARSGNDNLAYELAAAAISRGVRAPILFEISARGLAKRGRESEALAQLATLRRMPAGDAALLIRIGVMQLRLGAPQEAVESFDAAVGLDPDNSQAHYERGVALGVLGRMAEMQEAHERVIALEPKHADALASLALIAARSGDTALARSYAAQSLTYKPSGALADAALALAEINDGQLAEAQLRLDRLAGNKAFANDTWIDIALSDAGDAFARRHCFAQAFDAYASVGERRRSRQSAAMAGRRAVDAVLRRTAYFNKCTPWAQEASRDLASPVKEHVFILGFMRSATTLLATILASNETVCATDEREFLAEPAGRFLFSDETLDELANLGEEQLARWRSSYWKAVQDMGVAVEDSIFVNKMPFNALRLPLIAKFFPDARIILAVRDPRDVVLSCFRQRFEANPLTFEFLRLDDCARFYAATMELVERCRQKLTIRVREHKYEEMIGDFDASIRDVCAFLDMEWNATMRDFVSASGMIAPRSVSGAQVRRGLYSEGIGQWRRYSAQLAPIMPILEPWIRRFGYPAA
ncbi:MAG TPA: sulfotransferase [Rhizomicrobium sp.]